MNPCTFALAVDVVEISKKCKISPSTLIPVIIPFIPVIHRTRHSNSRISKERLRSKKQLFVQSRGTLQKNQEVSSQIRPAKALILVRMDVIIATEARILADKIKRHPLCMARRHHLKMGAPTQGAYRERFLHPAGKERNSVYWKMTQQRNSRVSIKSATIRNSIWTQCFPTEHFPLLLFSYHYFKVLFY